MKNIYRSIHSPYWMVILMAGVTALVLLSGCGPGGDGVVEPEIQHTAVISQSPSLTGNAAHGDRVGWNGFFPLAIGNRWTYSGEISIETNGVPPTTFRYEETHALIGTEELFGREYILERQDMVDVATGDTITYWLRYRQDRAGLYEADVAISDPPGDEEMHAAAIRGGGRVPTTAAADPGEKVCATSGGRKGVAVATVDGTADPRRARWDALCRRVSADLPAARRAAFSTACDELYQKLRMIDALPGRRTPDASLRGGPPGGVLTDEITRLAYPLHPRQEWIVREDPLFASVVEAHDVLDLPAGRFNGFRIAMGSVLYDPRDVVFIWYGRDGFLKLFAHIEADMVGPGGEPLGTVVTEEHRELEELALDGNGRPVRPGNRDRNGGDRPAGIAIR